jgi:hypothetical protein
MMTLASSVSEASSLLMTLESSFTIVKGLYYRPQEYSDNVTKEARSLYYKTLWIRYLREKDRRCSTLVDLAWTNTITITNKHTSLLRRLRICDVFIIHAQDCLSKVRPLKVASLK